MPTTEEQIATISALIEKAQQLDVDTGHRGSPNLTAFDDDIREAYEHYYQGTLLSFRLVVERFPKATNPEDRGALYKRLEENAALRLPTCLAAIDNLREEIRNHPEKAPGIRTEALDTVAENLRLQAQTFIEIGSAVDNLMESLRGTSAASAILGTTPRLR